RRLQGPGGGSLVRGTVACSYGSSCSPCRGLARFGSLFPALGRTPALLPYTDRPIGEAKGRASASRRGLGCSSCGRGSEVRASLSAELWEGNASERRSGPRLCPSNSYELREITCSSPSDGARLRVGYRDTLHRAGPFRSTPSAPARSVRLGLM